MVITRDRVYTGFARRSFLGTRVRRTAENVPEGTWREVRLEHQAEKQSMLGKQRVPLHWK